MQTVIYKLESVLKFIRWNSTTLHFEWPIRNKIGSLLCRLGLSFVCRFYNYSNNEEFLHFPLDSQFAFLSWLCERAFEREFLFELVHVLFAFNGSQVATLERTTILSNAVCSCQMKQQLTLRFPNQINFACIVLTKKRDSINQSNQRHLSRKL